MRGYEERISTKEASWKSDFFPLCFGQEEELGKHPQGKRELALLHTRPPETELSHPAPALLLMAQSGLGKVTDRSCHKPASSVCLLGLFGFFSPFLTGLWIITVLKKAIQEIQHKYNRWMDSQINPAKGHLNYQQYYQSLSSHGEQRRKA